jgi:hypothetical protein
MTTAPPPAPRRELSRLTRALLVTLRVYVIVAVPLIVFAFLHTLKP